MTQEDKKLLLKDLCGRLPYGVIVQYPNIFRPSEIIKRRLEEISYSLIGIDEYKININDDGIDIEYVKPYLRPMSSMTEEEREEYRNIDNLSYSCPIDIAHFPASDRIDWFNAHHFDYHIVYDEEEKKWKSMIEKGLAIEAPKGIYLTK